MSAVRCTEYKMPPLLFTETTPVTTFVDVMAEINPWAFPACFPPEAAWWTFANVQQAFVIAADNAVAVAGRFTGAAHPRGIVIVGGGSYFVNTYALVGVLREQGCELPIEIWHLAGEITPVMRGLLATFTDVTTRDASTDTAFPWANSFVRGAGWQLKSYALCHAGFDEVLLLDADNLTVRDPTFLFDEIQFKQHGAIFWPDCYETGTLGGEQDRMWSAASVPLFGVTATTQRATESGQLLVNRCVSWLPLALCLFYNAWAVYTYKHLYGDKDTFPTAWRRLGRTFGRYATASFFGFYGIEQRGPDGHTLFHHCCRKKLATPGFPRVANCYSADAATWHDAFGAPVHNEALWMSFAQEATAALRAAELLECK